MSLSNNYPTIRPTLEFDFANVGALDPRITFTRATSATFVNQLGVIQTAAAGVPRFDYDPSTLAARGLLVEEQRTNLLTYSEQFDNAAWVAQAVTVTANAGVAPDGTTTADKLAADNTSSPHALYNASALTLTAAVHTWSIFVKAAGNNFANLTAVSPNGGNRYAIAVDLTSGTVTQTASSGTPTNTSSFVSSYGNGWYRIGISMTASSNASASYFVVMGIPTGTPTRDSSSLDPQYTGDGTSGILIWGAQLEAGSFATSYIPTVASTVTRNADVASVDTLTPWWNASAATFYIENTFGSFYNQPIALAGQAAVGNAWIYAAVSPGGLIKSYTIGAAVDLSSGITVSANVIVKSAFTYGASGKAISVNGSTPVVSGNTTEPTASTQLNLGNWPGGNYHINGHIGRVAYYPARLTNAQLQALTS